MSKYQIKIQKGYDGWYVARIYKSGVDVEKEPWNHERLEVAWTFWGIKRIAKRWINRNPPVNSWLLTENDL